MTTENLAYILILAFYALTFLQSGYDKIMDWQGNLGWLKSHFEKTFIKNSVPQSLMLILILEIISGILCTSGIVQLLFFEDQSLALYGSFLSGITLLFLLFGQRIAKDYDGARTIAIYFIPAILCVYWLR
jgi:uncharacterized membrane protein YphA (DoxX/SURF4 family)